MALTLAYLKERLYYDPLTGIYTWHARKDNQRWNTKYAGKQAGYLRSNDGYWCITIDDTKYLAHRLAWFYMTGEWPEDEIDHWDLDRSNNRFDNLRPATRGQNKQNRSAYSNNKSGLKGVSYAYTPNRRRHWLAQICVNNKHHYLGKYLTKEEAAAAYEKAAKELHGPFSRS